MMRSNFVAPKRNSLSPYHLRYDQYLLTISRTENLLHSKDIKEHADYEDHGYPNGRVDIDVPIFHDRGNSRDLRTVQHRGGKEVPNVWSASSPVRRTGSNLRPSQSETKCGIDKARGKFVNASSNGQMRGHLRDTHVAGPNEKSRIDNVRQNDAQRTGLAQ